MPPEIATVVLCRPMEHTTRWHVAKFFYGHERAAAKAVDRSTDEDRGPGAFCPLTHRRWVTRGVEREVLVPVLSGYVFLEMEPGDPARWHQVAGQRGFHGFIGGEEPQFCRVGSVEALIARSTDDWVLEEARDTRLRAANLDRGSTVRVTSGHLEGCLGVVEWTRNNQGDAVAQLKINKFFGIDVRAEVPVAILERVGKREQARTLLDLPVIR